jgi:hypothetical protein
MPYVVIAARAMLVVIFATAFFGKVRNRGTFTRFVNSLSDFGTLNRRLQLPVAVMVVTAEAAIVVLVALSATVVWGLAIGCLMIAVFTVAALLARRHGRRPICNCFGAAGTTLGLRHIVRNCLIFAVAAAGLAARSASGPSHITAAPAVLAAGIALILSLALAAWDDIVTLVMRSPEATQ